MKPQMSRWRNKRINEICDLGRGRVISQEDIRNSFGLYPVFSSQSRDEGIFGFLNTFDFEGDYVTWTTDGANAGTVFFRSGRFNCTNVCGTLKPRSDEINARYLARALSSVAKRYVSYIGNPKLMNNVMAAIRLDFPTRPEQDFIAYVLDTIEETITKTEAVIAKLKQVRAGMLHDLLSYGLDEHGQLRDPVAHPEQFKDSPLGWIPIDWDIAKLGEAMSMQAGNILKSEHIAENGPYAVYGGNGIRGYTSTFTHEGLFAVIGRQGALCGNIVVASGRFYATEHAVVVTPKEQTNAGWLTSYLTEMNLNRFSESSALPGVSVQKISHHRLKIPKFQEQEAIDLCLMAIDKQLSSELEEVQKYNHLKSALQNDLLTGRIRVPETIMEEAAET